MSRRNAPRDVPYDFRVVELDHVVWLYDNSERTYICSQVPCIWMEPLYMALPALESECPHCHNGTIESNEDDWERRCRGECGSIWREDDDLPEGNYFDARDIEKPPRKAVPLGAEYIATDVDRRTAWDDAREEACVNCLI